MMRKNILSVVTVLIMVVMLAGCGKSDEQKARDEIMSHMSSDEKAAIAADQQAIADYEAEREAKANEKPIDYTDNMVEKSLVDVVRSVNASVINNNIVNVPDIKILLPDDQYITGSSISHISYGGKFSIRANAIPVSDMVGDVETCGNYNISIYTTDLVGYLYISEIGADECLRIESEGYPAVIEKNYDNVKAQLATVEATTYDDSDEPLGDAGPGIFGSYTGDNGNVLYIDYGADSFDIVITGESEYVGTLSWLADDLYESRADEIWLQVQFTEDGLTVRSSYLPLEGSYTRD